METYDVDINELLSEIGNGNVEDGFLVALGGILLGALAIAFVVWILNCIATMFVFKKMGVPMWKAWIPLYNQYLLFQYTWDTKWFFILLCGGFVRGAVTGTTQSGFVAAIGSVVAILLLLISIMQCVKYSKAFGHSYGFAAGLVFLPTIFTFVLGLGSSTYQGIPAPENIFGYEI